MPTETPTRQVTDTDVAFVTELIRNYAGPKSVQHDGFRDTLRDALEMSREIYDFVYPKAGSVSTGDLKSLATAISVLRRQLARPIVRHRLALIEIAASVPCSRAYGVADTDLREVQARQTTIEGVAPNLLALEALVKGAQSAKRPTAAGTQEAKRHAIACAARVLVEFLEEAGLPHKLNHKGVEISKAATIVAASLNQIGITVNERAISELKLSDLPGNTPSSDF